MKDPLETGRRRHVLAAAALLLTVGVPFLAAGSTTQWMTRSVHAYRVLMAIDTILENASPDPKHASAFDHRVRVIVFEDDADRVADIESVSLDVAVRGYTGKAIPLVPISRTGTSVFEGRVPMQRGRTYRILVHFRAANSGATHEAQYEYRHHH